MSSEIFNDNTCEPIEKKSDFIVQHQAAERHHLREGLDEFYNNPSKDQMRGTKRSRTAENLLFVKRKRTYMSMSPKNFKQFVHMSKKHFFYLATIMREKELLSDGKMNKVEDMLLMTIKILFDNLTHKTIYEIFDIPESEISSLFNKTLKALASIKDYIINTEITRFTKGMAESITKDSFFAEVIKIYQSYGYDGAVDGSVVAFTGRGVSQQDKEDYRSYKHNDLSLNFVASVDTNGFCDYISGSFPGSVHDYFLYKVAIASDNLLDACVTVDSSNYDSGDSGYTNHSLKLVDNGFVSDEYMIAPYKNTRYHLGRFGRGSRKVKNYTAEMISDLEPTDRIELFNFTHARLRVIVENLFGMSKNRTKIIHYKMNYPVEVCHQIIQVCLMFHNYTRFNIAQLKMLYWHIQRRLLPNWARYITLNDEQIDNLGEKELEDKFKERVNPKSKHIGLKTRIKLSLELEKLYLNSHEKALKDWKFIDFDERDKKDEVPGLFEEIMNELNYSEERDSLKDKQKRLQHDR